MKINKEIDFKLIIGLILMSIFIFVSFYYSKSFWYLYGASMLFLLSLSIFTVDLRKQYPFFKGLFPGIFSGIMLYFLFYIGAILLKVMPFGLDRFVSSAFTQFSPNTRFIWLLLLIAIIPAEEIFWRGFVLKRLNQRFTARTSILISAALAAAMMLFSHNIALVISMFAASFFWNALYVQRPSLLFLYVSHATFAICLLGILPIY